MLFLVQIYDLFINKWRLVEDSGGYPPPLIIYISDVYIMSGGYYAILNFFWFFVNLGGDIL